MKRTLALLLSVLMLLPILVGCTTSKNTTANGSGDPSASLSGSADSTAVPTPSPTPTPTPTPTPEIPLPSSATLVGTKHLPIVDSQGSIGCCSAEAVTYAQFTVAVSQYVNSLDPNSKWDPSSGADEYTFSPKYTFNFSGAGTQYNYEVLKTVGCLPMSISSHAKGPADEGFRGGALVNADQSRAWDVKAGEMIQALNFRLTGYEEDEFTSTNSGKLTTNETGLALLKKVKDAVNRGNAVVICGWSSYWQLAKIDNAGLGTLGKKNDHIIWNGYKSSTSESDGNHAVTIVGYDDDITVTMGGVTQKGAFQVMNSWGQYCNDGFVWMTYDACNVVSEFPLYQNSYFYKSGAALTFSGSMRAVTPYNAIGCDIETIFTPAGSLAAGDKSYPTYTLSHKNGKHLVYKGKNLSDSEKFDQNSVFAIIPYADVADNPKEEYQNSVLLYAVKMKQYLSLYNGRVTLVDEEDVQTKPFSVCLAIDDSHKQEDGSFTGMVNLIPMSNASYYERTGCIYRFSFIYWDKHIQVGTPKLRVEALVSAVSRDNLYIALNRTDKNGLKDTFLPASTSWRINDGVLPDLNLKDSDTLSFSGKVNPTEAEEGWFAFSFDALAGSSDFKPTDFLWGVDIKGSGVTVKQLRLLDPDGNVLAEVKTDGETAALVKGETASFVFDLGGEMKNYFGSGTYRLKNLGTGKVLSANGAGGMLFGWDSGNKNDLEKSQFNIEYNSETGDYRFWNTSKSYLFDIFKTSVKDGVIVKLNALNPTRNTQDWNVTVSPEGYLRITLKNYPDFAFGSSDGKTFTLSSTDKSDNFLWVLEPAEKEYPTTNVKQENGKTVITVDPFDKYTEGTVTVKIVKDGTVVQTLDGTPDTKGLRLETTLEAGCYLFVAMYNGEEVGTQLIYNVK